jgi:hypothetical protein
MTYLEKSSELACAASVAVFVLINEQGTDMEFLPLKPRQYPNSELEARSARWAGRGLRSVGVIGLVGTSPKCEFKEPLDVNVVTPLAGAFIAYLQSLFQESFAEQLEGFEIQELFRLWKMDDPRLEA